MEASRSSARRPMGWLTDSHWPCGHSGLSGPAMLARPAQRLVGLAGLDLPQNFDQILIPWSELATSYNTWLQMRSMFQQLGLSFWIPIQIWASIHGLS